MPCLTGLPRSVFAHHIHSMDDESAKHPAVIFRDPHEQLPCTWCAGTCIPTSASRRGEGGLRAWEKPGLASYSFMRSIASLAPCSNSKEPSSLVSVRICKCIHNRSIYIHRHACVGFRSPTRFVWASQSKRDLYPPAPQKWESPSNRGSARPPLAGMYIFPITHYKLLASLGSKAVLNEEVQDLARGLHVGILLLRHAESVGSNCLPYLPIRQEERRETREEGQELK